MVRSPLIVALLLVFPSISWAQTVCGPQDYDAERPPNVACPGPGEESMVPDLSPSPSIPVHQGEGVDAPWDGALVHRDRLIEYGLRIKALRRLRWADRLRLAERYRLELVHTREVAAINEELFEEQLEHQRQRALAAERAARSQGAWYRSVWFGYIVGTVIAGALVVLAAYVVTAL